jgi:hypothetical protein
VAVALSAVLGVAFRRTRRALMRLLHIDEGAGRAVEPCGLPHRPLLEARGRRRLPRGAGRRRRGRARGLQASRARPSLAPSPRARASRLHF